MRRNLPPPIRPSSRDEDAWGRGRGSLSDFSDYESSDEETHNRYSHTSSTYPSSSTSGAVYGRGYDRRASDDDSVDVRRDPKQGLLDDADPFADPFDDRNAGEDDEVEGDGVGTPGIPQRKMVW